MEMNSMSPTHSCVPWVPLCALVAYWGSDARGQHGTVTPGRCLYTLLGWKAVSGSPGFALLCSASACKLVIWNNTSSLLFSSDNICYGDGDSIPSTAASSFLILPTWLSTPPALKEVVPLLSEHREVLSTFAANNSKDLCAQKHN